MFVSAIIVAAGSSARMGENKLLLELGQMSVLERTLRVFDSCEDIDEIVLCASEANIQKYTDIIRAALLSKVSAVVRGGQTRQESVKNALAAVNPQADLVAVHDGARPLLRTETLSRVIAGAAETGCAVSGVKSADTIKTLDAQGCVASTIDREKAFLVRTPQVFRRALLLKAHSAAERDGFVGTDECSLLERLGYRVKAIDGDNENIKLTTPEDIPIANAILAMRGVK